MTIKEFYEYCVAHGAENFDFYTGDEWRYDVEEDCISINPKEKTVDV